MYHSHPLHTSSQLHTRPGRDTVHLVTVVPVEVQRSSGQQLLHDFQKQAERSMIDVRADVLVRVWGSGAILSRQSMVCR